RPTRHFHFRSVRFPRGFAEPAMSRKPRMDWTLSILLLHKAKRRGATADNYTSAICTVAKQKWRWGLHLLQEAEAAALLPKLVALNSGISACGRAAAWQHAVALLRKVQRADIISFSAGISACEKGQQWELALDLLEDLLDAHLQPDLIACNSLISACEKGHAWLPALAVLRQAQGMEVQVDVISFNAAISACAKSKVWAQALALLQELQDVKLRADLISFNSAIAGDFAFAEQLLAAMPKLQLAPDVVSYNAAMASSDWRGCLDLLARLRTARLTPSAVTCGTCITACGTSEWRQALQLLEEAPAPDVVCFNGAICCVPSTDQALQLLTIMGARKLQG
ncbi:unnamed protein product, partial [Effrenium voratum]